MIERWVASFEATPRRLGAYRIVYALFVLLVVAPGHTLLTDFRHVAGFPDSFFRPPPGPMMLADGFPPEAFFTGLLVVISVSAVALLVGYRTRATSVVLGLALLVGYGFSYSFGKVNHSILYVLTPLVMAASGWGAACSADAARRPEGVPECAVERTAAWPLALLALLVGFSFFTAGFEKLIGGWLDPSTQAVRGQFFNHFFVNHRQDLLAPWYLGLNAPPFWETLDVLTVVMEVGFLTAVARPFAVRCFAAVAVLFHFNVMLMFNIPFVENLSVYAAFFSWTALLPGPALALAGGLAFFRWGSPLLLLNRLNAPFASGLLLHEIVVLSAAAVLAGGFLLRTLWRWAQTRRASVRPVHESSSS